MTNKTIQDFLTTRGKVGIPTIDYVFLGDERDGSLPTFSIWNVVKLGPVPTTAEITAMRTSERQSFIDNLDPVNKAILMTILDEINILRADMTTLGINRAPRTPAQGIASVRNKIGTF